MAENLGELKVVPHQVVRIALSRGGAGTQMQHLIKFSEPGWRLLHARQQVVAIDVVGKLEGHEILPLFVGREFVGDEDVCVAAPVQLPDECAADEARASGDEDAAVCVLGRGSRLDELLELRLFVRRQLLQFVGLLISDRHGVRGVREKHASLKPLDPLFKRQSGGRHVCPDQGCSSCQRAGCRNQSAEWSFSAEHPATAVSWSESAQRMDG